MRIVWIVAFTLVVGTAIALACNLGILFSPSAPSIACAQAPGSVVAQIIAVGGDATPVTYTLSGSNDFAISGSNVVVAAGGIAPADCGNTITFTVTGTQN